MFSQERIRNARFMVVGCGALGNEVLKNLALFGAEHIVLVDFDEVEAGNLSRSVLLHVRMPKATGVKYRSLPGV